MGHHQVAADAGKTIFLTTQYLEEADRLADKIAILSHGRIAAEGTPQALKRLLPQGQIELRFADQTQLAKAGQVLADRHPTRSESALSLTISTDGSVTQVNRLFSSLEMAKVEVAEFAEKSPTLDEAFLQFTMTAKEHHDASVQRHLDDDEEELAPCCSQPGHDHYGSGDADCSHVAVHICVWRQLRHIFRTGPVKYVDFIVPGS